MRYGQAFLLPKQMESDVCLVAAAVFKTVVTK